MPFFLSRPTKVEARQWNPRDPDAVQAVYEEFDAVGVQCTQKDPGGASVLLTQSSAQADADLVIWPGDWIVKQRSQTSDRWHYACLAPQDFAVRYEWTEPADIALSPDDFMALVVFAALCDEGSCGFEFAADEYPPDLAGKELAHWTDTHTYGHEPLGRLLAAHRTAIEKWWETTEDAAAQFADHVHRYSASQARERPTWWKPSGGEAIFLKAVDRHLEQRRAPGTPQPGAAW